LQPLTVEGQRCEIVNWRIGVRGREK